ncbi:hypothetical protein L7F22_021808 [Adiantum nelumboides]|nr:hypothetical protein [Adiantum nelumboides]
MRLFSRPGFHHCSQKLALSAESSFSSCIFASSLFTASNKSVGFPRPIEIPWHKGLVNSVSLIGHINQSVDLKYLDTGKAVANTYIRVSRIAPLKGTDYSLFKLQFWDELAEIAAAHLKTEDHVCVTGSVWVESYMDQQSLSQTICKVVARDLKFVGYPSRTEIDGNAEIGKGDKERTATEDLWKNYFANPMDFWDNRFSKQSNVADQGALWADSEDCGNPRISREKP